MTEVMVLSPFSELHFTRQLRLHPDAILQFRPCEAVGPGTRPPHDGQLGEWTLSSAQRFKCGQEFSRRPARARASHHRGSPAPGSRRASTRRTSRRCRAMSAPTSPAWAPSKRVQSGSDFEPMRSGMWNLISEWPSDMECRDGIAGNRPDTLRAHFRGNLQPGRRAVGYCQR
jgi:hypothetical protein